jgi:hypothetical protein
MKNTKALAGKFAAFLVILQVASAPMAQGKNPPSMEEITQSTLGFIGKSQVKEHDGIYVPGEWKAQVYANAISEGLGIGETTGNEEPSAFTTGSIMNQLAMIHEDHPELAQIPKIIEKATPSLDRFREGSLYNFYPAKFVNGVRVHQAASMRLTAMWIGFTNVPEDADTTSVSYTARHYADKLKGKQTKVPESVFKSFSRFRDTNREPHWYNHGQRMINTGAFLTWQMDENDPRNATLQFADAEQGKRIPFKTNDVDCIVNLNALRMMALTGRSRTKGADETCGLMKYVIESEDYAKCGIYYPNTYNFAYSASLADKAGDKCLRTHTPKMVSFILKNQDRNGSWENKGNYESEDRVQATAYALHALTQFGDLRDKRVRAALENGSRFLKRRMQRTKAGLTYWPGETFFTATALARSVIDWKSDSYTTTLALSALLDADRALKMEASGKAENPRPEEGDEIPVPPSRPAF